MKMSAPQSIEEKKFGISGWMVHNIERLNVATDFEQFAHSPPETEGFLADPSDSSGVAFSSMLISEENSTSKVLTCDNKIAVGDSKAVCADNKIFEKPNIKSPEVNVSQIKYDNLHKALLEVLKCDDAVYSSPDSTPYSTPYATPQPSPAPQRKISFSSQETVQSNPEKWFYLGGKDVNKMKLLKSKEKEKKSLFLKNLTDMKTNKIDEKSMKAAKINSHENPVKLAISNFDLNAISPSSW